MFMIVEDADNSRLVEEMIVRSQKFLFIVTPYFNLYDKVIRLLNEAADRGVKIFFVYRQDAKNLPLQQLDNLSKKIHIGSIVQLHSKVYVTEKEALVTSFNLFGSTSVTTYNLGIHICRPIYNSYARVFDYCKNLISGSIESVSKIKLPPENQYRRRPFGFRTNDSNEK